MGIMTEAEYAAEWAKDALAARRRLAHRDGTLKDLSHKPHSRAHAMKTGAKKSRAIYARILELVDEGRAYADVSRITGATLPTIQQAVYRRKKRLFG